MPKKENGHEPPDVERFERHIRQSIRDFLGRREEDLRERFEGLRPSEAAYVAAEMCVRVGRRKPAEAARFIQWLRLFAACEASEARAGRARPRMSGLLEAVNEDGADDTEE